MDAQSLIKNKEKEVENLTQSQRDWQVVDQVTANKESTLDSLLNSGKESKTLPDKDTNQ